MTCSTLRSSRPSSRYGLQSHAPNVHAEHIVQPECRRHDLPAEVCRSQYHSDITLDDRLFTFDVRPARQLVGFELRASYSESKRRRWLSNAVARSSKVIAETMAAYRNA